MCGCFSACSSVEQQECQMPKALFLQGLSLEAVHHPMGLPVTPAQFGMPTGLEWNEGNDGRGPPGPLGSPTTGADVPPCGAARMAVGNSQVQSGQAAACHGFTVGVASACF